MTEKLPDMLNFPKRASVLMKLGLLVAIRGIKRHIAPPKSMKPQMAGLRPYLELMKHS